MMLNQLISITVLLSSKALYVSGFSTEVKSTAASAAGSKQQTSKRIAIVGAGVSKSLLSLKCKVIMVVLNNCCDLYACFKAVGR